MIAACLGWSCRVAVAVVFGAAAFGKLRGRAAFAEFVGSLADFGWLPARLRRGVAVAVVGTEVCVAGAVLVPGTAVGALVLGGGLLAGFSAAVGSALLAGERVRCLCFGGTGVEMRPAHLVRNGVTLLVVAAGIAGELLAGTGWPALGPALAAALAGAVVGLAVTRWDDLSYLFAGA